MVIVWLFVWTFGNQWTFGNHLITIPFKDIDACEIAKSQIPHSRDTLMVCLENGVIPNISEVAH